MAIFINLLTISRMALGAFIFILLTRTEMYWIAFVLFFIASITDYFDGYLARKYNHVSQIGEVLDPIADKILIVFLLFAISRSKLCIFTLLYKSLYITFPVLSIYIVVLPTGCCIHQFSIFHLLLDVVCVSITLLTGLYKFIIIQSLITCPRSEYKF